MSAEMTLLFRMWERESQKHATFRGWRATLITIDQVEPDEQDQLELGRRASVCLAQDFIDSIPHSAVRFLRFTPEAA